MSLLEETEVNNCKVKYYFGLDIELILDHPKDGSMGMMVVFFNSVDDEKKKHKRDQRLLKILESRNIENFDTLLDKIDNHYVCLYQTHGYTNIIHQSIKFKLETIKDFNFRPTTTIWEKPLNI